jgi:YVTN family beta-propeller protein
MTFQQFSLRAVCLLAALAMILSSQSVPREQPGFLPDGRFLLNSGWTVKPAGQQVKLDTLPMSSVLTPDGKYLIVLHGGYNPPSLSVLDTAAAKVVSTTPIADAFLGLALSSNGRKLWVGGGSTGNVFEFSLSDGKLSPTRTIQIGDPAKHTWADFTGDVALSPDGKLLYAASIFHDAIVAIDPETGKQVETFKTGRRPYRILFHPDGQSIFVTSWADASLYHHQAPHGGQLAVVRLGAHPTDIVWRDKQVSPDTDEGEWKARLFISAANTNSVYVVGVGDSNALSLVETINVATTPLHPLGMTPSALAMSADKQRLFVVCSDANAVAVADITDARTHVLGFIPVGWYPTAAKALPDGRLVVLNGKGDRSYPNPGGPNPTLRAAPAHVGGPSVEYVGHIQTGTASIIPPITDEALIEYSNQVIASSPYTDEKLDNPGVTLPAGIEHVIYIVKENRTYDQVLGDIGKGASDPSLTIFPEKVSPNHHKLAREFVLLDNFYVSGDVSADGHNWSTAAIASDYVQKFWPNSYAKRRVHYDYEGGEPAAGPPAGYLWTNAAAKGISMRNYGYFANGIKTPGPDGVQVESVRDPILASVTSVQYRPFDLDYPDVNRAAAFLKELDGFEKAKQMPKLIVMRLGNDHTSGTAAGKIAPLSSFADNDYALGQIVEGVSKSTFWKNTAIFVLEDDAQNGPDHIDSHRSPAFVLSPYTRRGVVDSTMYNTVSVLRTMEMILGMRPMTHFDAGARPMSTVFTDKADLTPYQVEKPRIPLDDRNPANTASAARSAKLDFDDADLNDDDEMNDILWRAIRGTAPPAPVRSFFSK